MADLGKGLFQGMAVTAKNFVGSYFDGGRKERLATYQYPEEKMPLPQNSRTFPFLVFDGQAEAMRCTACKICEVECPPQCIYIVMDKDEKGKPRQRPKVFDIDISVCMQCGICVEVCPFESIKMDCDYEQSKYDRFEDLVMRLPDLLKSNEYYHQIKPDEATIVDANLKAEAEKKAAKKAAVKPATPAPASATASAPKPVTPVATAPTLKPLPAPPDVLSEPEKKAWLAGYQSALGSGAVTWPPTGVPAAPKPVTTATPAPATVPSAAELASGGEDWPWHDAGLDIKQRMELAKDRSLADKLMAAMAQTDCHACGYDCRGYADALGAGMTDDITLCAPGEEETAKMLEQVLKAAGKR
jgi:NADH-quinone oxidoreductase subunit I